VPLVSRRLARAVHKRSPACHASATEQRSGATSESAISAEQGAPEPLGPSPTKTGVNFAVFSAHATTMKLCLFDKQNEPIAELGMHKSGDVFHVEAAGCPKNGVLYGIMVNGKGGWETGNRWDPEKVLLDPYTPLVSGRRKFGERDDIENYVPKARSRDPAYDV
jgi:isoamylase